MSGRVYPTEVHPRFVDAERGSQAKLQPIPPPVYARRRHRSPCCCCLAWFCSLLLITLILLAVAGALFYFLVRPKAPKYDLLDAHISQLNITGTTPSQGLNYDISFTIKAYNPNKKIGIYYDEILISLFYDSAMVGQSSIAPFYQGHRNTTILTSDLQGQNVVLAQPMLSSLQIAIANQSIPFQVDVKVKARVKISFIKSPRFTVKDNCDVSISPPSGSGGAQLQSKSCNAKWAL